MFRKKQEYRPDFPRDQYVPALRKSICTGEESFGFIRYHHSLFSRRPSTLWLYD